MSLQHNNEATDAPPERRPFLGGYGELAIDKAIDLVLIFVGLYAAIAVQRYQDDLKEQSEYVALLSDFRAELTANLAQEADIAKDLGAIDATTPGENLGPMATTFTEFFTTLDKDEKVVHCLHVEFAAGMPTPKARGKAKGKLGAAAYPECHVLYKAFDAAHGESASGDAFGFKPAVLTPFYRYEVWQLYLADGVKTFRNKELAIQLGQIYSNARLIEKNVADIEATYNNTFMVQVARSAATDEELAEIVHDEEVVGALSPQNQQSLLQIMHQVKDERYAAKEAKAVLELKVERMKRTVLLMRQEIRDVTAAIDAELQRMKS
jgi:hypothetical protein